MIDTTIIIILLVFLVVIADGFRRAYKIRREGTQEIRRRTAVLVVGQEWQSESIVYNNPFKQAPSVIVRITDLKANHAGNLWVEFSYLDNYKRQVIRHLPASKFCEIYTIKIKEQ